MENPEIKTETSPSYKGQLYKQGAMIVAGLFGGPLASAYVIAHNFKALGDRGKMYLTWIIASLILLGDLVIDSLFPQLPGVVSSIIVLILLIALMNWFQAKAIDKYIEEGHEPFSNWKGLRVGLISLVIIWGFIFILGFLLQQLR
jgi:hypothetical protein